MRASHVETESKVELDQHHAAIVFHIQWSEQLEDQTENKFNAAAFMLENNNVKAQKCKEEVVRTTTGPHGLDLVIPKVRLVA